MKEENNEDDIDDDSWALYADASYGNSVIESDVKKSTLSLKKRRNGSMVMILNSKVPL